MGAKSSACHWPTFSSTLRNPSRRLPHQNVGFGGVYPRPEGEGKFVATLLLLGGGLMFVKHLLPRMTRLPSEMSRNWEMLRCMALPWDLWLTGPGKCNFSVCRLEHVSSQEGDEVARLVSRLLTPVRAHTHTHTRARSVFMCSDAVVIVCDAS